MRGVALAALLLAVLTPVQAQSDGVGSPPSSPSRGWQSNSEK